MTSEQLSAEFYERIGPEGLAARTTPLWDEQILARIRGMVSPGQRILDVGCGYGRIAIPLAESGFDVTGLDLSSTLLRAAQQAADQRGVSVLWVEASMCRMPLPDASFDVAFCLWSSFQELLEEQEQLQAIRGIHRVLRPGAWCLVEGPPYRPATAEDIAAGRRCGPKNRVSMDMINGLSNPHYCHDRASLGRLMKQAGIDEWEVHEADWAGRLRQFLRFVRSLPAADC